MALVLVEVFSLKVFSSTTLLWKMLLWESKKVILIVFLMIILHKYKNAFNNNKLLKRTFIKKRKYYNKPKTFIKKIYKHLYCWKNLKNYFYEREVKEEEESDKEAKSERKTEDSGKWYLRNIWNFLKCFFKETPPKCFFETLEVFF